MVEDVVRSLGYLCLGSRLKRIGERLQAETQIMLDGLDPPIQSSHHPILAALDHLGPLTIGELAQSVGIAQPGMTRAIAGLSEAGVVEIGRAEDDRRVRIVSLTPKGEALVARAWHEAWPQIERAVAQLCGERTGPLLQQLAAIEDGLAEKPLHRRHRDTAR